MKKVKFFQPNSVSALLASVALVLSVLLPRVEAAPVITLTDSNSVAKVDVGTQSGMFSWQVQGQNQLVQQWFWYRIGSAGPEQSIDTISAPAISTPNARSLTTTYANTILTVRIDYLLSGGAVVATGNAVSDIAETITITNHTQSPLNLHFYQYSDFDVGGPSNDTVQLGTNLGGLYNEARQSDPLAGLEETVNTPGANRGETAFFPVTLNKLNNGIPDDLPLPTLAAGPTGPGDVTWALQWDWDGSGVPAVGPGASVIISKDKRLSVVIPEPASIAVLSLGIIALVGWRRR
jgi:hypothetical protein